MGLDIGYKVSSVRSDAHRNDRSILFSEWTEQLVTAKLVTAQTCTVPSPVWPRAPMWCVLFCSLVCVCLRPSVTLWPWKPVCKPGWNPISEILLPLPPDSEITGVCHPAWISSAFTVSSLPPFSSPFLAAFQFWAPSHYPVLFAYVIVAWSNSAMATLFLYAPYPQGCLSLHLCGED